MLTQDPMGLAGGVNLYEYAGSNPVAYSDPFGLEKCEQRGNCTQTDTGEKGALKHALSERKRELNQVFSVVSILSGRAAAGRLASYLARRITADDKPASTPVGGARSPMDVPRGTNTPTTVNGRRYTGHAQDQMQSRGVPPSAVEEAIRHGNRTAGDDGAIIMTTDDALVILNPNGSVKTVWQK